MKTLINVLRRFVKREWFLLIMAVAITAVILVYQLLTNY